MNTECKKAYVVLVTDDENTYIAELENAMVSTEFNQYDPFDFNGKTMIKGELKNVKLTPMPLCCEYEDIPDEEILNLIQEG